MYETYKQGMDFKDIASKAADMILIPVPELDTASLKNYHAVKQCGEECRGIEKYTAYHDR